ncbi:cache domain-containing protein [Azospirillum sp. sgz302134]
MPRLPGRLHLQTLLTVLPVLLLLLVIAVAAGVPAGTRGTEAEAKALLDKAATFLRGHGAAAAADAFSRRDGAFIDRDLYPTLIDRDGNMVAHGWTPTLNGANLMDLKDVDGRPFIREALDLVAEKGAGAVSYKWTDPLSGQIAPKTMHVRRIDLDGAPYMLSVGVYR